MTTRTIPRRRHRHELTERQRSAFSPPCYHSQAAMDAAEQAREDAPIAYSCQDVDDETGPTPQTWCAIDGLFDPDQPIDDVPF